MGGDAGRSERGASSFPERPPDGILFAQHGWADTNRKLLAFGHAVAPPRHLVVAPSLGYLRSWRSLEPLVDRVEGAAEAALAGMDGLPIRVVGHSMGGLIWLAVLDRRPEWRERTAALVLIASPVGGAELGAAFASVSFTIARDLSVDRRSAAERVTEAIPTLAVAGDLAMGADGTISVASARLPGARLVCLPRASHAGLLGSRLARGLARAFLLDPRPPATDAAALIGRLRTVPGMGDGRPHDVIWATVALLFRDGYSVRHWTLPFGGAEVFVVDNEGCCQWAGVVHWQQELALREALRSLGVDVRERLAYPSEGER